VDTIGRVNRGKRVNKQHSSWLVTSSILILSALIAAVPPVSAASTFDADPPAAQEQPDYSNYDSTQPAAPVAPTDHVEVVPGPQAQQCPTIDQANSAQFTAILNTPITSKMARNGDPVYARLGSPLTISGHLFAPGSMLLGQITEVDHARRHIMAEVSPKRWLNSDGGVGMEFDQVIGPDGSRAPICGVPMKMSREERGALHEKSIAVSKKGVVGPSRTSEILPKLTRTAIGAAATITHSPIVPLAGGLLGAIAPSLVLESTDKEYQSEIKHRRLKGFAAGAIAGVPGGFLVNDTLIKGRDAMLPTGTVLFMKLDPALSGM